MPQPRSQVPTVSFARLKRFAPAVGEDATAVTFVYPYFVSG